MTQCNAGDILKVNYTHDHDQWNHGQIRVVSSDWSVTYYPYTQDVGDSSTSISITLTDRQAEKLNQDKSFSIDGEMLIINSIELLAP